MLIKNVICQAICVESLSKVLDHTYIPCRQNSNVITVHLVLPPTHHNHLILMQRSNGIDTFTLMVFGGVFVVISNPPRGGIYANDMDIGEYIAPELVPNNIDHQHIVLVYISKYLILQITQSAISHQKQSKLWYAVFFLY